MIGRSAAETMRTVLTSAAEEASRRGDRRVGTDHLLLGLLHQPDSRAARALGISLE
ncbi:MAG: Clp protease N-terminal domain-containing protein, partial [Candidatus Dormibacteria bacterium]